jgi:hypothetical protein
MEGRMFRYKVWVKTLQGSRAFISPLEKQLLGRVWVRLKTAAGRRQSETKSHDPLTVVHGGIANE